MVSSCPKDHWTLKTGYFEDPTPARQVQTLSLEGPRSLGWEETKLMLQKSGYSNQLRLVVLYYYSQAAGFLPSTVCGGFKYFLSLFVPPYLEEWSNLTNIFQLDWNHQLATQMTTVEEDVFEKRKLNRCDMFTALGVVFGSIFVRDPSLQQQHRKLPPGQGLFFA